MTLCEISIESFLFKEITSLGTYLLSKKEKNNKKKKKEKSKRK